MLLIRRAALFLFPVVTPRGPPPFLSRDHWPFRIPILLALAMRDVIILIYSISLGRMDGWTCSMTPEVDSRHGVECDPDNGRGVRREREQHATPYGMRRTNRRLGSTKRTNLRQRPQTRNKGPYDTWPQPSR